MQVAIRRVIPTARQKLARPQRLGLTLSTRLRLHPRTQSRCFSHSPSRPRTHDGAPARTDGTEESPVGRPVADRAAKDWKEGEHPPEAGEEKPEYIPEVSPEEIAAAGGVLTNGTDGSGDRPPRQRGRPAGTKSRTTVVKKPKDIPKPVIPDWFIRHAVVLKEENTPGLRQSKVGIYTQPAKAEVLIPTSAEGMEGAGTSEASAPTSPPSEGGMPEVEEEKKDVVPVHKEAKERYQMHESVWKEITTHVRTGLLLPKTVFADGLASMKSHTLLHLPKEGGLYYLDAIAEKIAAEVDADLVRMDAQDFAEIAGDYLGDSRHVSRSEISSSGIRSLGYDTQVTVHQSVVAAEDDNYAETTEEAYEDEDDVIEPTTNIPRTYTFSPTPFNSFGGLPLALQRLFRVGQLAGAAILPMGEGDARLSSEETKELMADRMNERKMRTLMETMVSAGQLKRTAQENPVSLPEIEPKLGLQNKTIIHIRDYLELERTNSGQALLKMLHSIVQDRRRDGERIVVLGTTSTEEPVGMYTTQGVRAWQSRLDGAFERTIVVPPVAGEMENAIFKYDQESRVREVNIRHIRDVIRRRSGENGESATLVVPANWHFNPVEDQSTRIPDIETKFWDFDYVHRIVTVALGEQSKPPGEVTIADLASAVRTVEQSDSVKFQWAAQEFKYLKERTKAEQPEEQASKSKPIPKGLNNHEKKLVAGIIDPKDIHTTFASVRAPPETIDSMKTLTSLSLVRPEAFKYGVLATDRIPGVLLYGPPGTGKTLLARAVAKESGATVLEVSGSDIFNMYVGEGEKNVRAIFSLAKKLSPCVVFVDEADAIFGSRQSFSGRSSHREIINQFLKEWADMDSTAFIMVATNRPFDLDDAVLRRLPRRILIDLPTPEDRLEIMKIHLTAETLDPSVDLKEFADRCALYSGSDLKNLCVSAALSCVKEENAESERTGKFPEKRILSKLHFEKAMNEISASISDDMGSLGLIRKFDDKYGERAGRKKRKSAWGFELGQAENTKGEGRVRMA